MPYLLAEGLSIRPDSRGLKRCIMNFAKRISLSIRPDSRGLKPMQPIIPKESSLSIRPDFRGSHIEMTTFNLFIAKRLIFVKTLRNINSHVVF